MRLFSSIHIVNIFTLDTYYIIITNIVRLESNISMYGCASRVFAFIRG